MSHMKTISAAAGLVTAASTASAAPITFGDVTFPAGPEAFADEVVSFQDGVKDGPDPTLYSDPTQTLGVPDFVFGSGFLSLGVSGSVTLKFTDNAFSGSDNDAADLYVVEIGPLIESTFVAVSKNGVDFLEVGSIGIDANGERNYGIDLDAFGFGTSDVFSYVRLTDDGISGANGNISGADIDAVGAISSVPAVTPVPLPAAGWMLFVALGGLAAAKSRKTV